MKRLRLISTILVPSAKGERIVKFRHYTGDERETGLGVNMSYSAFPTNEGSAMPFNTIALRALQFGSTPGKNAQYIKK